MQVHQAGTLSASIDAVRAAKEAGWGVMVGHGSGETDDAFIADLAVGLAAGHFKAGAPCQSERLAKYNQVICRFLALLVLFLAKLAMGLAAGQFRRGRPARANGSRITTR